MPVIFISRGTMSGVHMLVDCLHDRMGIRCITREDLDKIVNEHGGLATRIVEKLANATSAYIQFSKLRWPYNVLMRQALLEEVRHDNMVYHGYSGHLLLQPQRHFARIRIEAPLELRVKMTMRRMECDEAKAREYINEVDDHRVKWARYMFAQDIRNTMLYDLHLNLAHMTVESACRIIENLMKDPDFQATPESQAKVNRLYFAANIEEALVTDPRTAEIEISAKILDDKTVQLTGPYLEEAQQDSVMEIVTAVSGVTQIQYIHGYAPSFQNDSHL
jgi:cytidylate kinase